MVDKFSKKHLATTLWRRCKEMRQVKSWLRVVVVAAGWLLVAVGRGRCCRCETALVGRTLPMSHDVALYH
eukprot:3753515-Amphidinium_carterae.1